MSVLLFDSPTSNNSITGPRMTASHVRIPAATSILLFDSQSSNGSSSSVLVTKRHRSIAMERENCGSVSPQKKKQRIDGADQPAMEKITVDDDGHINCHPGFIINGMYKIICTLGEGAFGRVIEVQNTQTNRNTALKTVRNVETYRTAAKSEIMILEAISRADPQDTSLCIKMLDSFELQGHICIQFEALGENLYQFMKDNQFQPFPLDQVRHIAHQLCHSVNFLHQNGITHTDLKPDNILFVDSSHTTEKHSQIRRVQRTDVRLIDFGNAVLNQKFDKSIITTRFYRAPEVILELGWTHACDVWSIGCILFELYIGDMLFVVPDDNHHHLAVMEKIIGEFPLKMTVETQKPFFVEGKVNFDWKNVTEEIRNYYRPLSKQLSPNSVDIVELFDLIKKMLVYEPSNRITLNDALKHSFFNKLT